eukprot:3107014-Rhodomonas_salina.3
MLGRVGSSFHSLAPLPSCSRSSSSFSPQQARSPAVLSWRVDCWSARVSLTHVVPCAVLLPGARAGSAGRASSLVSAYACPMPCPVLT